jgi:uncharacterized protein
VGADRLEALGETGVERCLAYARHKQLPLATADTLLAHTDADIDRIATPERFAAYASGRVSSVSVIDHFWDKLLHIGNMTDSGITNRHLIGEAQRRAAHMRVRVLDMCMRIRLSRASLASRTLPRS